MNEKENPLNVTPKLNCESFIVLPITHPYKCTLHSKPPEAKQLQLVRYRIYIIRLHGANSCIKYLFLQRKSFFVE